MTDITDLIARLEAERVALKIRYRTGWRSGNSDGWDALDDLDHHIAALHEQTGEASVSEWQPIEGK